MNGYPAKIGLLACGFINGPSPLPNSLGLSPLREGIIPMPMKPDSQTADITHEASHCQKAKQKASQQ